MQEVHHIQKNGYLCDYRQSVKQLRVCWRHTWQSAEKKQYLITIKGAERVVKDAISHWKTS